MAEHTCSSPRTPDHPQADPSAVARHARVLVSPPASRLRWITDDPGPRRLCTTHVVGGPLVGCADRWPEWQRKVPCYFGGHQGDEHAVHPGADHTLCGRSVDWLLHGSEAHPRDGRLTARPSWPASRRCVECTRRLATRLLVRSGYRHVCAVCRYTLPHEARRPMAGVRSTWVRSVLDAGAELGEAAA